MSLQSSGDLNSMDNSEELVDQRPFDIMIPSSPSDIGMITDAGVTLGSNTSQV